MTTALRPTALHPTIARLALRSIFGRRRGVLLFVLPLVLLALAILVRVLAGEGTDSANLVLDNLGLSVVVPLIALVATTGLLAPEIDDGSVVYLLAKPISRHTIMVSKLVVAVGCVVVFAAAPMLVAGLVLASSDPRLGLGYAVGSLAGGIAYCALFALLSVLTRHAVVVGLIYLLIWEGLLGGLLDGVRWLSVTWWAGAITEEVADGFGIAEKLGPGYASVATVVVIVVCTVLAGHRLRSFNLTGDE
ncbi:MAG TPA: ABC transporter permease subunit [Nocardioidaceae bacterium]|nr:ABC transporter permease subunit [Nocardioidaceae bacterium]